MEHGRGGYLSPCLGNIQQRTNNLCCQTTGEEKAHEQSFFNRDGKLFVYGLKGFGLKIYMFAFYKRVILIQTERKEKKSSHHYLGSY